MPKRFLRKRRVRRRQGRIKVKADLLDLEDQLALPALDDALAKRPAICQCAACMRTAKLVAGHIPHGWNRSPVLCPGCNELYRGKPKPGCPKCGGTGKIPVNFVNDPAINYGVPINCECTEL